MEVGTAHSGMPPRQVGPVLGQSRLAPPLPPRTARAGEGAHRLECRPRTSHTQAGLTGTRIPGPGPGPSATQQARGWVAVGRAHGDTALPHPTRPRTQGPGPRRSPDFGNGSGTGRGAFLLRERSQADGDGGNGGVCYGAGTLSCPEPKNSLHQPQGRPWPLGPDEAPGPKSRVPSKASGLWPPCILCASRGRSAWGSKVFVSSPREVGTQSTCSHVPAAGQEQGRDPAGSPSGWGGWRGAGLT